MRSRERGKSELKQEFSIFLTAKIGTGGRCEKLGRDPGGPGGPGGLGTLGDS